MKKIFFKTKDGIKLCGILETPKEKEDKVIILAHGLTVDKDEDGVFTNLSKKLCQNGFAVFRFDFRGRGESSGKQQDMTISNELIDLEFAFKLMLKDFEKIGLVGASFGGGIATLYAAKNSNVKSLCLWNPVLNFDHTIFRPFLPWLKGKINSMLSDVKTKGWTTFKGSGYKLGIKLFVEMRKCKPFTFLDKIQIPTLIIHGTKDTKVPYDDSLNYSKNLINGRLITIKNAEHGFHQKWEAKIAIKETSEFFLKNLR